MKQVSSIRRTVHHVSEKIIILFIDYGKVMVHLTIPGAPIGNLSVKKLIRRKNKSNLRCPKVWCVKKKEY